LLADIPPILSPEVCDTTYQLARYVGPQSELRLRSITGPVLAIKEVNSPVKHSERVLEAVD